MDFEVFHGPRPLLFPSVRTSYVRGPLNTWWQWRLKTKFCWLWMWCSTVCQILWTVRNGTPVGQGWGASRIKSTIPSLLSPRSPCSFRWKKFQNDHENHLKKPWIRWGERTNSLRPISGTVAARLNVGDIVFLTQESADGFVYSSDGGSVLTFRGELIAT